MFSVGWPWMIALLPLPLLVRALKPSAKRDDGTNAPEISFPHIERLRGIFPRPNTKGASRLVTYGLFLVWVALIAALMRPEVNDRFTQVGRKGHDLVIAADLSGSMQALDYMDNDQRISRLEGVKSVVGDFIAERQGDRIGLLLFGSNAYLHVPLTLDLQSVRKMLSNTAVGEAGDQTAIGDAIGLAVDNLRTRPENSRVIILMTDGDDNASSIAPLDAAALARQYGIRIYTIGVGSDGPAPFPDGRGGYVTAQFHLDETLLKKIADMTGGSYSRASDTKTLKQIYARIDTLEKTSAETRSYVISRPLYRYPLGVALALLLLLQLMPIFVKARDGN